MLPLCTTEPLEMARGQFHTLELLELSEGMDINVWGMGWAKLRSGLIFMAVMRSGSYPLFLGQNYLLPLLRLLLAKLLS